jgi:hypothetical protein
VTVPVTVAGESVAVKVTLPPASMELADACSVVMVAKGPLMFTVREFEVLET